MKISAINTTRNTNGFKANNKAYTGPTNYINQDRMLDSFVKMARIDTGSDREKAGIVCPTSKGQLELGEILADELRSIGLKDVQVDENGFVLGTLESNTENAPTVALLAHMDTSSDANTSNVNPIIHNYSDGDIVLKDNQIIKEKELEPYKNTTIVTSDGTSLLGADDKAGIAEILEAVRVLQEHPELKRPTIRVVFTPDEEGADGIENIDIKKINADVAYTIDGLKPCDVDTETFNAYNPEITIKGVSSHCGYAYNKMVNSISIANEFINKVPMERPETTQEREGYYHIGNISGSVNETKIKMLVRDFDDEKAKERIEVLRGISEELQEKYPESEITFKENEAYKNIKQYLNKNPEIIEYTKEGIRLSGIEPEENSVRGGTDGSELTLNGLPCPNLGAGGENFHTHREFVSLDSMKKCCENIINIIQVWANENNPFN